MSAESLLLLDTCAAIWFAGDMPMAGPAVEAMNRAFAATAPVFVSPITAWEIGMLCARGRLRFPMPPQSWFNRLRGTQGMALADLSPEILIAGSFLPGNPPRDPADRIIAATAREYGYKLVTRDRPLLEYAEQGHIQALPC
jgi:PIN domain nuclease of toxin-antitoxin system